MFYDFMIDGQRCSHRQYSTKSSCKITISHSRTLPFPDFHINIFRPFVVILDGNGLSINVYVCLYICVIYHVKTLVSFGYKFNIDVTEIINRKWSRLHMISAAEIFSETHRVYLLIYRKGSSTIQPPLTNTR